MKVSIVIPVYNAEQYLDICIKSVLEQSYSDMEITAVNDGSKDNSLKILQKYAERIKIINKKNGGTSTALNMGIREMQGEWFKWLSADDSLKPDAIKTLIEEVQRLGDTAKSCIFYSHYDLIDGTGNVIGEFIEPDYNELEQFDRNVVLLDHFYGNGTTSLIHRSIFEKHGYFDETVGFQEDYEFWLRCCLFHGIKMHLIPHNIVNYRVHEEQLTKKNTNESLHHAEQIRKTVLERVDPLQREKYIHALKRYKRQKPLNVRMRRTIRDIMFRVLPKNTADRTLQIYMNRKKY